MRSTAAIFAASALVLVACASPGGSADWIGEYTLVSVDGSLLPMTPQHEGGAPQILASTLELVEDGTFSMSMIYAGPDGKSISRDFKGTYSAEGDGLKLAWEGAGVTPVTFDGNQLTLMNEGIAFTYQK